MITTCAADKLIGGYYHTLQVNIITIRIKLVMMMIRNCLKFGHILTIMVTACIIQCRGRPKAEVLLSAKTESRPKVT